MHSDSIDLLWGQVASVNIEANQLRVLFGSYLEVANFDFTVSFGVEN